MNGGDAGVVLRPARESDLPRILEITQGVVALINSEGNYQWNHTYPLEDDFRRDIADDVLWVACSATDDHVVLGFAALTTDQPEEYSDAGVDISTPAIVPHRVAVAVDAQSKGIASLFMHKAEELAKERGINLVRVDTNAKNARMQRVIEKRGYTLLGEISFKHKPEIYGKMMFKVYEKLLQQ